MTDDIEKLRDEVAALRIELAEAKTNRPEAMSRRRLLSGLAGLGAAGAAGVAAAQPAAAADGDPLILGEWNSAVATTALSGTPDGPILFVTTDPFALPMPEDPALSVQGGDFGIGVRANHVGVAAISSGDSALNGWATDTAAGVRATSDQGIGVDVETGGGVHLRLRPSSGPPPTAIAVAQPGSIYADSACALWLCTSAGPPPVWTQLLRDDTAAGRVVPITPIRALDTRAPGGRPAGSPSVPGQKAGPLKGGSSLTLDLAGIGPIPTTASGVIGNLAAVTPSFSGYLAARPSGTTAITTSLNFPRGVAAIANAFTSQLGPAGLTITGSGTSANSYHLVVDINAYIT